MSVSYHTFIERIRPIAGQTACVITANQRQSRQLIMLLNSEGHDYFAETTEIHAFGSWVDRVWLEYLGHCCSESQNHKDGDLFRKRMINSFESRLIWKTIVDASPDIPALINKTDLIKQLISAHDVCSQFLLRETEIKLDAFAETRLFLKLRRCYLKKLQEFGCIDSYQFLEYMRSCDDLVVQEKDNPCKTAYLYGFSEIPPLYLEAIKSKFNGKLYIVEPPRKNTHYCVSKSKSLDDEIQKASQWAIEKMAQQHLEDDVGSGKSTDASKHRLNIAIVTPELSSIKTKIERAFFKEIETKRYLRPQKQFVSEKFDISAGASLDEYGLVQAALLLPGVCQPRVKKEDASYVARSPFWGRGYSDLRQALNEQILLSTKPEINFLSYLTQLQSTSSSSTSDESAQIDLFSSGLNNEIEDTQEELGQFKLFASSRATFKQKLPFCEWVRIYLSFLKSLGFPGQQTLSSFEYQLCNILLKSIEELSGLDSIFKRNVPFSSFLDALHVKCKQTIFRPEVKAPAIQILGLMEASGLSIKHCYFLGFTEKALPLPASPHPFLPISIQKKYGTPRSSSRRELQYSEALVSALFNSSEDFVASYHLENEQTSCGPSPLLEMLSALSKSHHCDSMTREYSPAPTLPSAGSPIENKTEGFESLVEKEIGLHACPEDLHKISIGKAPAINAGSQLKGGAYMLETQWTNPLFAFFRYRLHIDKVDPPVIGVNKLERGTLVHNQLFKLYSTLENRQAVNTLITSESFENDLSELTLKTLSEFKRAHSLSPLIYEYEVERLKKSAEQCLISDSTRKNNFQIYALESRFVVDILNYTLPIRIDRIDAIIETEPSSNVPSDIKLCVLDYKTGKKSITSVLKEQTHDYQLPLYCIALEQEGSSSALGANINTKKVTAATYVEISPVKCTFNGVCANDLSENGIKVLNKALRSSSQFPREWPDALRLWQENIEERIQEFVSGEAYYRPRALSEQRFYAHYNDAVRPEERPQPTER